MFTIAGSGFGLYGYLPALVETFGEAVVLPRAYEGKVRARPELRDYLASIRWTDDGESALAMASGVVVAKPPQVQPEIVSQALRFEGIARLVLEKPLALTPLMATQLVDDLRSSGKQFRVGYTLLHTAWSPNLAWPTGADRDARALITWTFMAHHFSNVLMNWKREHSQGGGVLRFFGVHVLALLARHGYREVERSRLSGDSRGAPERWSAVFSGTGLPPCHVEMDSRCATSRFSVAHSADGKTTRLVDLDEPFQLERPSDPAADRRVEVLKRLLGSFRLGDAACYELYEDVNRLWQAVELASSFEVAIP